MWRDKAVSGWHHDFTMVKKKSVFFLLAWNDYRIFQGISRYAQKANWQMDTRYFFLNQIPYDRKFDGMIIMYHHDPAIRAYSLLKAKQVPTVILGTVNPGIDAPMVSPDSRQAGIMAAGHLHDLFHKHYGWFARDICQSGTLRKQAFEQRLRELGFACTDLSCGRKRFDAGTVIGKLKHSPRPLGVMTRDDHDAATLIDLCQQAGLRVPEDIAIIGVGDIESLCKFAPLPVSSISLNMDEIGFQSAAVLDHLLHGRKVPKVTLIPPGQLIQRASTNHVAITNPRLNAALKIIDRDFKSIQSMNNLATMTGISRRQLYLLFRDEMRCSPGERLMQKRIQHARMLLEKGKLSLKQVANECGFCSSRTINRLFQRHFGLTPSLWRKGHTGNMGNT